MLLWTINEYPSYGHLFGQTVKEYYACLVCSENTFGKWLKHGSKMSYLAHRQFLTRNHLYRGQKNVL